MRVPKIDPIDYLVTRRFPDSYTPAPREGQPVSARRQFLDEIKPPPQEILDAAREYRKELESLPGEEVKKLYDREVVINSIENDKTKFFNKPEAQADFEYWSKMSHWTLDEAIALSFGKNPKVVYWKRIEKILSHTSPFVQDYRAIDPLRKSEPASGIQ